MIIVTGASGMLGTQLIQALSNKFPKKNILGIYGNTVPQAQYENVEYISCDLKDYIQIEALIENDSEVYHCAAKVAFDKKSHATLIEDNVLMTENVVNACIYKHAKKLVHVSSIAALSREQSNNFKDYIINESATWTNSAHNSFYAKSKYYSELEVWRGIEEGLNAVIINPGIILGESNKWDVGSSAIIDKIAKGLKYYTHGINGYVDVKDVVDIMILLMENDIKNERFIVVQSNYSYKELFEKIAFGLKIKPPSIEGKKWMSNLLVKFEALKSALTNKIPLITKETSNTAFQINKYDNSKLLKHLPEFNYRNFDQSIDRITKNYTHSKK